MVDADRKDVQESLLNFGQPDGGIEGGEHQRHLSRSAVITEHATFDGPSFTVQHPRDAHDLPFLEFETQDLGLVDIKAQFLTGSVVVRQDCRHGFNFEHTQVKPIQVLQSLHLADQRVWSTNVRTDINDSLDEGSECAASWRFKLLS